MSVLTRTINLRGAQGRSCDAEPEGVTARSFRAWADRDAAAVGVKIVLRTPATKEGPPWYETTGKGAA